jgi:putative ABC transport system permease protein
MMTGPLNIDWQQGVKMPNSNITTEQLESIKLQPTTITAVMLGLNSRMATFRVQRDINNYRKEPLTAILPGVALSELWQMMGILENTLRLISWLILIAALLGLSAMMLASIREREHEIHLLRVIGAPPVFLFLLIEMEALLICLLSIFLAISGLYLSLRLSSAFLASNFSLHMSHSLLSANNLRFILLISGATVIAAALPSFFAYRKATLGR